MGRLKKIDRPRQLNIKLPDSLYTKLRAELYSEIEERVPFGALSNLGVQLFTEWLESRGVVL